MEEGDAKMDARLLPAGMTEGGKMVSRLRTSGMTEGEMVSCSRGSLFLARPAEFLTKRTSVSPVQRLHAFIKCERFKLLTQISVGLSSLGQDVGQGV